MIMTSLKRHYAPYDYDQKIFFQLRLGCRSSPHFSQLSLCVCFNLVKIKVRF